MTYFLDLIVQDAYKKYIEGLALVSTILKNEVNSLHQPNVVNMHKHMVEFVKRSADRLLTILQKFGTEKQLATIAYAPCPTVRIEYGTQTVV